MKIIYPMKEEYREQLERDLDKMWWKAYITGCLIGGGLISIFILATVAIF